METPTMETFSNPEASSPIAQKFRERLSESHRISDEGNTARALLEEIRHV